VIDRHRSDAVLAGADGIDGPNGPRCPLLRSIYHDGTGRPLETARPACDQPAAADRLTRTACSQPSARTGAAYLIYIFFGIPDAEDWSRQRSGRRGACLGIDIGCRPWWDARRLEATPPGPMSPGQRTAGFSFQAPPRRLEHITRPKSMQPIELHDSITVTNHLSLSGYECRRIHTIHT
jgi:hypothetical protein